MASTLETLNAYLNPKTPQEKVQVAFIVITTGAAFVCSAFFPFFITYAALCYATYRLVVSIPQWANLAAPEKPNQELFVEPIFKAVLMTLIGCLGLYLWSFNSLFQVSLNTIGTLLISTFFIRNCVIETQQDLNIELQETILKNNDPFSVKHFIKNFTAPLAEINQYNLDPKQTLEQMLPELIPESQSENTKNLQEEEILEILEAEASQYTPKEKFEIALILYNKQKESKLQKISLLIKFGLKRLNAHDCELSSKQKYKIALALYNEQQEINHKKISVLLSRGADPFAITTDGNNAFHLAIQNNDISPLILEKLKAHMYHCDFLLKSNLRDNDPENAEPGKLYLANDGSYIARDHKGIVHQDTLPQNAGINLNNLESNLNNPAFKNAILDITSKKEHTLPFGYPKIHLKTLILTARGLWSPNILKKLGAAWHALKELFNNYNNKNTRIATYQASYELANAFILVFKTMINSLTDYLRTQIAFKADINAKSNAGNTPLDFAYFLEGLPEERKKTFIHMLNPLGAKNGDDIIDEKAATHSANDATANTCNVTLQQNQETQQPNANTHTGNKLK